MSELRHETCCWCGEATGKAGAGEGSLYFREIGPWCDECYDTVRDTERQGSTVDGDTIARVAALHGRLNAALALLREACFRWDEAPMGAGDCHRAATLDRVWRERVEYLLAKAAGGDDD